MKKEIDTFIVTDHIRPGFEAILPFELVCLNPILIGAAEKDHVCGVMAVMVTEYEWTIEYLYVPETCRRTGVASAMMRLLLREISFLGIRDVTAEFTWKKDNPDAENLKCFFEAMGLTQIGQGELYTIEMQHTDRKLLKKERDKLHVAPLADIPEDMWEELRQSIESYAEQADMDDASEDTNVYVRLWSKSDYLQDRSFLYLDDLGHSIGCILMEMINDIPQITYLYVEKDTGGWTVMEQLILAIYDSNRGEILVDEPIYINVQNKKILPLLERITGGHVSLFGKQMEYVLS